MKDWKAIGWIIGIPVLIILLMIGIVIYEPVQNGISRGEAARAAVLALLSREECESFLDGKTSHFPAGETDQWYVKYMDYLYENGYLDEETTAADEDSAEGYITYGEVERLAGTISSSLKAKARATVNNREKPIPRDEWWLFYDSLLNTVNRDGQVKEETLTIYQAGDGDEDPWTVYTSAGALDCEGLTLKRYEDRESRAIYREAVRTVNDRALTPEAMQEQLREPPSQAGAMLCDYDFFRVIYHAEARAVVRNGNAVHIALLSVTGEKGSPLPRRSLDRVMEHLQEIIRTGLRKGDIASRCSVSQYILMLPQANYENSRMVCDRVIRAFFRQYPHSPAQLHYSVQPLEPNV